MNADRNCETCKHNTSTTICICHKPFYQGYEPKDKSEIDKIKDNLNLKIKRYDYYVNRAPVRFIERKNGDICFYKDVEKLEKDYEELKLLYSIKCAEKRSSGV